ncbi:MAG: hypothetical protein WBX02_07780 [Terriglobales bacterium]
MNSTVVQQVEKWYAEHAASLSEISTKLRMTSIQPRDAIKGSVAIEIETPEIIASAAFWNWNGDVSFITVNKRSREEKVDDRRLAPSDDIPSMLNDSFRKVTGLQSNG